MDKKEIINISKKYAKKIKRHLDLVKVILFGSYAKDTFNDDSDIDIAVVLKNYDNRFDIQFELMKLRRDVDSRIEPHPFKEAEFNISNPLVEEIIKYGKEIEIT